MGKKKRAEGEEQEEEQQDEAAAAASSADEAEEAATRGATCKHTAKHVKASSIRAHLKKIPALVAAKRASAALSSRSKSSSKPAAADAPTLWLCLSCDALDVDAKSHFDAKKHTTGLELVSLSWRCFPCNLTLGDSNLPPKALEKVRLITQQVETEMKKAGATNTSASTSSGSSSSSSRESSAATAQASPVAGGAAAPSASGVVVKGLRNLGNTCFMNSVLQCLASTTPLYGTLVYPQSSLFDDRAVSMQAPLQRSLLNFLQAMQAAPKPPPPPPPSGKKNKYLSRPQDESRVVTPSEMLSAVQTLNPMFRGSRQHDSHELLRTVLNGIVMEKEAEQHKQRQAATAAIVKTWSAERVLQWIESWGLSCYDTVATNLLTDGDRVWDGAFVLSLLSNWANKQGKQPRIVLHRDVKTEADKRIIARNLQRLKDGNLPPHVLDPDVAPPTAADADSALHPHSAVLQSTFVHQLFGGVLRNVVECLACHTRSTTHELFMDLSLAIEAPRLVLSRQEIAAMTAAARPAAAAASSSAAADKKRPSAPSASAISKARNKKHQSKSQRRQAKRASRRASASRAGSKEASEDEDGEDDEAQDGEAAVDGETAVNGETATDGHATADQQYAGVPSAAAVSGEGETAASSTDAAAAPAEAGANGASAPVTTELPAATDAATNSTAAAPSADAAATEDAATAPVADTAATNEVAAVTDAVASLSLSASSAAENDAAKSSDAAPASTDAVPSAEPAAALVAAAPASAASAVAASTTPATGAPSSSADALAFLAFARLHRLGMDRLAGGRDRTISLADCLRAYTDPDLLTGSNRYGCSECSRRATEAQAASAAAIARSASPPPAAVAADSAVMSPPPVQPAPAVPSASTEAASPVAAAAAEPSDSVAAPSVSSDAIEASVSASSTEPAAESKDISSADAAAEPAGQSSEPKSDAPLADGADQPAASEDGAAAAASSANGAPDAADASLEESLPTEVAPPPPVWIKQDAVKRTRILVPPTVLTLHLKRFHQNGRSLEKSSRGVEFPLCLNLADYMTLPVPAASEPSCVPSADATPAPRAPDCFYHLYGIVSHGGGMGGGHYVAYMRKENVAAACANDALPSSHGSSCCASDAAELSTGWFYASDSDTRPVSAAEIARVQAFILFYVKA